VQELTKSARLATLDELLKTVIPAYFNPAPTRATIRSWLDEGKIPRFKANLTARRGGGTAFYSVPAVEKFFRSRTLPPIN
jgi:trehalose utilization protein